MNITESWSSFDLLESLLIYSCSGTSTWQHGNSLVNYMKLVRKKLKKVSEQTYKMPRPPTLLKGTFHIEFGPKGVILVEMKYFSFRKPCFYSIQQEDWNLAGLLQFQEFTFSWQKLRKIFHIFLAHAFLVVMQNFFRVLNIFSVALGAF